MHTASVRVLSDFGIRVLSEEWRGSYVAAGMTDAGEQVVRFDPDLVEALVSDAPPETMLHGRGDSRNVTIGGKMMGVCTTGETPNLSDAKNGRRPG
ncbi:trimethylamine methyltransferase family protein [Roseovarius atlanticus]|uniref:trimethylamine methyltransferase family protein n=1 Tax=Roseovarius atlanticus TaxID=1641875 RepID=UPI0028F6DF29|nr:trimethylamine methyltransferase family protein [Roseovarius atlanticus]